MYCKECNQEILETAKFCPNCGSKVEQFEEVEEVIEVNEQDETVELPIVPKIGDDDIQSNKLTIKKVGVIAITWIVIISVSSISLYKAFTGNGNDKQAPIIIDIENSKAFQSSNEGTTETQITKEEAKTMVEKLVEMLVPERRVEVISDSIRKDGVTYYEASVYTDINGGTFKLATLYVDKHAGNVYMENINKPSEPWIKVEDVSDTMDYYTYYSDPLNLPEGRLSNDDYSSYLNGTWVSATGVRIYDEWSSDIEGYDYYSNQSYIIIDNITIINKMLETYIKGNVMTLTGMARFRDTISETDLNNSIIVKSIDDFTSEVMHELIIFAPNDYTNFKVYELVYGETVLLEERGHFFLFEK